MTQAESYRGRKWLRPRTGALAVLVIVTIVFLAGVAAPMLVGRAPGIAPGSAARTGLSSARPAASTDGQQILRGRQIADRIAAVQDTSPFLAAGQLADVEGDCYAPATSSGQLFGCPGSGRYLTSWQLTDGPNFRLFGDGKGQPEAWVGGEYTVVARVHAHGSRPCGNDPAPWCRDALTLEEWIAPPPELKPTPSPTPTAFWATPNPVASLIPTTAAGEPVYYGSAIDVHLKSGAKEPFLVTGVVMEVMPDLDCVPASKCPAQFVLIEPGAIHWKVSESNYPLLTATGFWKPGPKMDWPGGVVVLSVRPSNRACPAGFTFYCGYGISDPLIVDAVIPPPK